jgi:hypothetical protein
MKKITVVAIFVVISAFARVAVVMPSGCTKAGQIVLSAGQCVLDSGVLGTVAGDLLKANYVQLITDLEKTVAPALIKCALQAIAASEVSPPATDAGVVVPAVAGVGAYDHLSVVRAKELLAAMH